MYTEAKCKKLSGHCSNAVASTCKSNFYPERLFYRTGFVDKYLLSKEGVYRLLSVYKQVKPSLSFAAVVKNNKIGNEVTVHSAVSKLGSRGQQPMVQSSRKTAWYGNSSRHMEVVKDSTDFSVKQGVSHMARDVNAHVKCEGNDSLTRGDRFVHKNRFQPLGSEHIESCIENKCQTDANACVGKETQNYVVPVSVTVKDGDTSVRGKVVSPHCTDSKALESYHSQNDKTYVGTESSGVPACKAISMLSKQQKVDKDSKNLSESANSAVGNPVGTFSECMASSKGGTRLSAHNACQNTVENVRKVVDTMADKYALELQTTLKKEKLKQAKQAPENQLCISQNVPLFGFIPIYGLKNQVTDKSDNAECTDILQLHRMLRKDGRHNYKGLQVPVPSKLNYEVWSRYLQQYWDWQLPLLIKYGFPLDFNRDSVMTSHKINHKSATDYAKHVSVYLEEELRHQAILGPFKNPPIPQLHTSPFMTRDKPNSEHRRVIIDLSWPLGGSVNAGVPTDQYLGTDFVLTYPSVDNITQEVLRLGKGCKIFKVDISRAFRHVPMDPGDLDLLGLYWNAYFLDRSLPFGFKHGSSIFQRISDAVRFIMSQEGHGIWNYIDDFLCVSLPSKIDATFSRLQGLLQELGLTVSAKKLVAPSTQVTCLGIVVDTVALSVSIPSDKLSDIKSICSQWDTKQYCTKKELQSLLGLLLYVTKCIKYARYFLNRMLMLLRENAHCNRIRITEEFRRDLRWFNAFLPVFNGVSFFNHPPSKSVHLDACPSGLGAIFDSQVYTLPLPSHWRDLNIAYTELINILVALKVWHNQWAGSSVLIRCDNQAVVSVLTTGKTRDPVMAKYVRNIFLWLSAFNIDIRVIHIAGRLNPVADLLSRWHLTKNNVQKLQELVHPVSWVKVSGELLHVNESI